jgi:hypothetical protein
MINLENLAAFVLGMLVVYLMFRSMGVFIFLLCFAAFSGSLHAQDVGVTNWPVADNPLPVVLTAESTSDVWPAAAAGFGFGLTCCGFGMVLRMSKRTANDIG